MKGEGEQSGARVNFIDADSMVAVWIATTGIKLKQTTGSLLQFLSVIIEADQKST